MFRASPARRRGLIHPTALLKPSPFPAPRLRGEAPPSKSLSVQKAEKQNEQVARVLCQIN